LYGGFLAAKTKIARVFESLLEASAERDVSFAGVYYREKSPRCPDIGIDALCLILAGPLTEWLDHFFMDAP
jgi:hypothetical protein